MRQLINSLALAAALVALVAGLWQDWGVWTVIKRVVLSYLSFFIFGAVMALAVRSVPLLEGKETAQDEEGT